MFEDDGMPNKFLVQAMTDLAKTTAVDDACPGRCGYCDEKHRKWEERIAELEAQLRQEQEAMEYNNHIRHEAEDMAQGYADALKAAQAQVAQLQATVGRYEKALKRVREDCFDDSEWAAIIDAALATCRE